MRTTEPHILATPEQLSAVREALGQTEPDPFPQRKTFPLRAVGGNVLLRKVAMDVHRSGLVIYSSGQAQIFQIGEVVGLGGRWTQDRPWQPPMPTVRRGTLDNGDPDPNWRPPDLSQRPAILPARFAEGHREWLETVKVGDLVVYTQARAYDIFTYKDEDFIVYPGCWLHGTVEHASIADHPELRRYMKDSFDTEAPKPAPRPGQWTR